MTPRIPPDQLTRRAPRPRTEAEIRQTDLGEEKRCPDCGAWWPHDRAFFYAVPRGGLTNNCRACRLDADRVRRGIEARPTAPVPELFGVKLHAVQYLTESAPCQGHSRSVGGGKA